MEKTFDTDTYVICHNGAEIIHPSVVQARTKLSSGQPQYEEFSTEEEWKARLTELGYDISNLDIPKPPEPTNFPNPENILLGLRPTNEE
jgi:hypothetical protein